MKIAALVLAAGRSSRMGSPKALLPYAGTSFVGRLVDVLAEAGAAPLRVVVGPEPGAVAAAVDPRRATLVVNPEPERGMLRSIALGLASLDDEPDVAAALVCPVDHPAVEAATVRRIMERFRRDGAPIVLPVYRGRRGHPVLFARRLFDELRRAPEDVGARRVVWDHAGELAELAVDDPGVAIDVDTPEDYRRLCGPDAPPPRGA